MNINRRRPTILIENTNFIWETNFSGDPNRDRFGSSTRKANVIIPDHDLAMELMDEGFNVKATKPKPDEDESTYIPTYWVPIIVKYDSEWPPKIYLVSGDADPVLLDEETVGDIDDAYVLNVNVELSRYYNKRNDRLSLYVKTMYVEQDIDNDPFARRYVRN